MLTANPSEDLEFQEQVRSWVSQISQRTCYHTLELPGGQVIPGIIPADALRERFDALHVPPDLRGKRCLDVGAASGWNSFELEKRGAEVVAVDCAEYPELPLARAALGSRVDYRILDVDELSPEALGLFDYVFFLGVLYHLRHPLLGLERICALTRGAAFVESFVTDNAEAPSLECRLDFYETGELGGQIDNWYGPTTKCLLALCRSAGFARVKLQYSANGRAGVICSRTWEPAPAISSEPAPRLMAALNNRTNDIAFHPNRDEYLCIYCRSDAEVTAESIRVEVDGLGAPAVVVAKSAPGAWQTNVRVPPGLAYGPHTVRLRTAASGYSNEFTIIVRSPSESLKIRSERFEPDGEDSSPAPALSGVYNSADGSAVFHDYRCERLSCFVRTAERGLSRRSVLIQLDSRDLEIEAIIELGNQEWQINVKLPANLAPGAHEVRVRTAKSPFSGGKQIETITGNPGPTS